MNGVGVAVDEYSASVTGIYIACLILKIELIYYIHSKDCVFLLVFLQCL